MFSLVRLAIIKNQNIAIITRYRPCIFLDSICASDGDRKNRPRANYRFSPSAEPDHYLPEMLCGLQIPVISEIPK